jgi:hypothetical protein
LDAKHVNLSPRELQEGNVVFPYRAVQRSAGSEGGRRFDQL